jgi:hypothetical protein
MSVATVRELGQRWRAASVSPVAEQRGPLDLFFATSLSKRREKAVLEFVETLQYSCPDLYSERVLQHRHRNALCQAIASFALGAICAQGASPDIPIIGDSALVLFAIACWSLAIAVQLWRTHRLVKQVRRDRSFRSPLTHQPLARHQDRL